MKAFNQLSRGSYKMFLLQGYDPVILSIFVKRTLMLI